MRFKKFFEDEKKNDLNRLVKTRKKSNDFKSKEALQSNKISTFAGSLNLAEKSFVKGFYDLLIDFSLEISTMKLTIEKLKKFKSISTT